MLLQSGARCITSTCQECSRQCLPSVLLLDSGFAPVQGVSLEEVSKVLRSRFGTSGIEEKAARPPKSEA